MHILLTDILTCPRCGPQHGLILLSHDMRDRRVHEGWLGCANCRARWVVSGGFGEFRAPYGEEAPRAGPDAAAAEAQEAMRIAALLGVTEGPANVLIVGPAARHAAGVADLVEHLEVVAALPALAAQEERSGVSRMAIEAGLPFYDGRMRGVWLSGAAADLLLEEGIRVLHPMARLVLEPAPADADSRLEQAGMRVVASRDETVVAMRNA